MPRRRSVFCVLYLRNAAIPSVFGASLLIGLTGCGSGIAGSLVNTSTTPTSTPAPSAVRSGPQLGYVWSDKAHTLRPVLGIPGSSQLGQSVVSADLYIAASTSAVSNLAILQESDGVLDLISLPTGSPVQLSATVSPTAQIRFSPSGISAIAFQPGSSTITLFTALTTTPKSSLVAVGAAVSEAAVSDAGTIAAALQQSSATSIRTIAPSGTGATAGSVATLGGLSFIGATDDLLLADSASNAVTMVRNTTTSPTPVSLQSASLLKSPQGVGATHDGHYAVLSNTGNTSIVRLDLTAQTAPQSFSCTCQPALVAQLSGTGVFRVTAADSGPAWMFDASATQPRVLFIPAITPASDALSGSATTNTGQN